MITINCNQYFKFEKIEEQKYKVTKSGVPVPPDNYTEYVFYVRGVTNSFTFQAPLGLNESTTFTLPEDGVYQFYATDDDLINTIFVSNILELGKLMQCYYSILEKIKNPVEETLVTLTCNPCDPLEPIVCPTCKLTKKVNQVSYVNYINAMFPYIHKLMLALAADRLVQVGIAPFNQTETNANLNMLTQAFNDLKIFTNLCGQNIFDLCGSNTYPTTTTSKTKTCGCK